jgi:hypothetical protein
MFGSAGGFAGNISIYQELEDSGNPARDLLGKCCRIHGMIWECDVERHSQILKIRRMIL